MSYSLENFCADARKILSTQDDHTGRDLIRGRLEQLLAETAFLNTYTGPDAEAGVSQIYEDPDYHFCVLAYNMDAPRTSPPHDHGSSWAVYGQASGFTDMTIWSVAGDANAANEDQPDIRPTRSFRLDPGQAGLFDVREIHSIDYPAGAKFIRVTGVDMSQETRRVFDPETGAVRTIEHVGTGSRG